MTASVRIDDESFDRLKQLSEDEDRPMTRIVRAAIDAYDQLKLAKATQGTIERTKKAPESPKSLVPPPSEEDIAAAAETDCTHPKETLRKLSWGTLCGLCGTVLK